MFGPQIRPDHPDAEKIKTLHEALLSRLPNHEITPTGIDTTRFNNWLRENLQIDPESLHWFVMCYALTQSGVSNPENPSPLEVLTVLAQPGGIEGVARYAAAISLGFTLGHEWARMRDMEGIGAE